MLWRIIFSACLICFFVHAAPAGSIGERFETNKRDILLVRSQDPDLIVANHALNELLEAIAFVEKPDWASKFGGYGQVKVDPQVVAELKRLLEPIVDKAMADPARRYSICQMLYHFGSSMMDKHLESMFADANPLIQQMARSRLELPVEFMASPEGIALWTKLCNSRDANVRLAAWEIVMYRQKVLSMEEGRVAQKVAVWDDDRRVREIAVQLWRKNMPGKSLPTPPGFMVTMTLLSLPLAIVMGMWVWAMRRKAKKLGIAWPTPDPMRVPANIVTAACIAQAAFQFVGIFILLMTIGRADWWITMMVILTMVTYAAACGAVNAWSRRAKSRLKTDFVVMIVLSGLMALALGFDLWTKIESAKVFGRVGWIFVGIELVLLLLFLTGQILLIVARFALRHAPVGFEVGAESRQRV